MNKLEVINFALMKCGLPLAATLTECDYNAGLIFDNDALIDLESHAWGFAQKFAVLEKAATPPLFGKQFAYLRPNDCVRLIDVRAEKNLRAPKGTFVKEGEKIYADVNPCYARYVWRCLDPTFWPAYFCDVVAAHIACDIAALSAEKMALVPQLYQLYSASLNRAMANDAREETERVPLDDSLFAGRGRSA